MFLCLAVNIKDLLTLTTIPWKTDSRRYISSTKFKYVFILKGKQPADCIQDVGETMECHQDSAEIRIPGYLRQKRVPVQHCVHLYRIMFFLYFDYT